MELTTLQQINFTNNIYLIINVIRFFSFDSYRLWKFRRLFGSYERIANLIKVSRCSMKIRCSQENKFIQDVKNYNNRILLNLNMICTTPKCNSFLK